jgi:hypothetical protein
MPFRHGSVSYARLHIEQGDSPVRVDDRTLETLRGNAINPDGCGNGVTFASGWVAGRHLLDVDFSHEANAFDGAMLASIRTDSVAVPAAIRRAYRAQAERELQVDREEGRALSRRDRLEAKERAEQRWMNEVGHGLWRRHAERPLLWDLTRGAVLGPFDGEGAFTQAKGVLAESFGVQVVRCHAGRRAVIEAEGLKRGSALRDIHLDAFVAPPTIAATDAEGAPRKVTERPDPAWAAGDPFDYLGNVFLLWLWWRSEAHEGLVTVRDEHGRDGEVALVLERVLHLECAWSVQGAIALRGDAPTHSPEAGRALQGGRVPRRMGMTIARDGRSWRCTLQGDRMTVSGLALERPEEPPKSERERLEQRVESGLSFDRTVDDLYRAFLVQRLGSSWASERAEMSRWIAGRTATRAGAAREPIALPG